MMDRSVVARLNGESLKASRRPSPLAINNQARRFIHEFGNFHLEVSDHDLHFRKLALGPSPMFHFAPKVDLRFHNPR